MRVVILNGSARGSRGVTGKLVSSITTGLSAGGGEVVLFEAGLMNIAPCSACLSCMRATPGACALKDEMEIIYGALKCADLLIMATPVYLDSMTSQLKRVMDRCICCMQPSLSKDGAGRVRHGFTWHMPPKFMLIATSGFPERETFDPIIFTFRAEAANFDAEPIGEACIPGSIALQMEPLLLERPKSLLQEAGTQIAKNGRPTNDLMEQINTSVVDIEEYLRITARFGAPPPKGLDKCRISVRGFAD